MPEPLLSVHINASYGKRQALRDIRFDLRAGQTLGLIGTSGAGKSTLAMAILGLLPLRGGRVTGEILLEGRDILQLSQRDARKLRGKRMALVPQSPMTALNAVVSLRTHFEAAWRAHESSGRKILAERLEDLLPEMQLPTNRDFLARRPGEISVGQAQRVLIALALLHRPVLLIADEPTSALDLVTQTEILKLLKRLRSTSNTALLYISHDLISVLQLCERIAILDSGAIAECLSVDDLSVAKHPATLSLLAALPVPPELLLAYRDRALDVETNSLPDFSILRH